MTLFLTLLFVTLLLAMIPFAGAVVATALYPGLTVAFMVACRRITRFETVMPTVLVAPFRDNGGAAARPLVTLGILFLISTFVTMGITVLIGGDTASALLFGRGRAAPLPAESADFLRTWIGAVALQLVVALVFWFAPVLVAWHAVSPIKAVFFSAVAMWRNLGAFVVLGLTLGASIVLVAALMLLIVTTIGMPPTFELAVMVPLSVAVASIVECASYVSYRMTFAIDDDIRTGASPG